MTRRPAGAPPRTASMPWAVVSSTSRLKTTSKAMWSKWIGAVARTWSTVRRRRGPGAPASSSVGRVDRLELRGWRRSPRAAPRRATGGPRPATASCAASPARRLSRARVGGRVGRAGREVVPGVHGRPARRAERQAVAGRGPLPACGDRREQRREQPADRRREVLGGDPPHAVAGRRPLLDVGHDLSSSRGGDFRRPPVGGRVVRR